VEERKFNLIPPVFAKIMKMQLMRVLEDATGAIVDLLHAAICWIASAFLLLFLWL